MQVSFIAQPFENGFDLGDYLLEVLNDQSITVLDIAVAWAKRSGLLLTSDAMQIFRERGGSIRMIIGISEGGATRQGLEMALDLANEVYIFHNPSGRTFHPKVYAAYGDQVATVLVGSHNLTRGGIVRNYEAGILCRLNMEIEEDRLYLDSIVNEYFERLLEDSDVCVRLDADTFTSIIANPVYRVGDEDRPRNYTIAEVNIEQQDTDSDSITDDELVVEEPLFKRSKYRLRSTPRINTSSNIKQDSETSSSTLLPLSDFVEPDIPVTQTNRTVVKRWFKQMSSADAQRPNPGTNHTGHLTLTRSRHPIDNATYFREIFFSGERWHPVQSGRGQVREQAYFSIEIIIRGRFLGVQDLIVDHNPSFESSQGNRTTTLRWGDRLNEYLRQEVNLIGDFVTIERFDDDSYRLIIDESYIGPFIA